MEKADYVIKDKVMCFAIRIVNLYKYLVEKDEFVMSKQVLRSGTSIGANYAEALKAESPNDFIHNYLFPGKRAKKRFIGWNCFVEQDIFRKNSIFLSNLIANKYKRC